MCVCTGFVFSVLFYVSKYITSISYTKRTFPNIISCWLFFFFIYIRIYKNTDVCNQHRTVRERDMQEKKKNTKSGFSILG